MHPGSLFLGFALLEFSCLSNSGSHSDNSKDGAVTMDWFAYTKYKPHKNAISFFKKLGYKDIATSTWKPEEEPRMNFSLQEEKQRLSNWITIFPFVERFATLM
jgi:hypothetical protein